ncbi:MAG: aspartate aminotransferase family protein [Rhodospirillales bacterium]|nr:aspartate aminotransferase family protein [Rhodospirillales bacterium]
MSHLLHRSLAAPPPMVESGQGIWLRLASGAEVIDGSGGAAVACLGHGEPRVIGAIAEQSRRVAYAHTWLFASHPAEDLAAELLRNEPGDLTHAFFVSSGSEGMEAALKLARQYFIERREPWRTRVIARRQSYHGNTLGALAAGGNMARRALYEPLLAPVFSHVSPCFPYRFQAREESEADYAARLAAELEEEFQRLGPKNVIAFCAEPVVGATAGCVPPVPGYFRAVRNICDRHGALLILDEVMCGMGRTGTMHAWEQEGVAPDIQVIAKGLGGGYQPIGGILIGRRIVEALRHGSGSFVHGHTYQAHPVACAAALAVQRVIAEDGLLANVRAMGARLEAGLAERFGNHPHVGDIRGRGLFHALEFVADRATREPFLPRLRVHERVKAEALARGLAIYPMGGTIDGATGDHVIVAPPYIIDATGIDMIVERLGKAVEAALDGALAAA